MPILLRSLLLAKRILLALFDRYFLAFLAYLPSFSRSSRRAARLATSRSQAAIDDPLDVATSPHAAHSVSGILIECFGILPVAGLPRPLFFGVLILLLSVRTFFRQYTYFWGGHVLITRYTTVSQ